LSTGTGRWKATLKDAMMTGVVRGGACSTLLVSVLVFILYTSVSIGAALNPAETEASTRASSPEPVVFSAQQVPPPPGQHARDDVAGQGRLEAGDERAESESRRKGTVEQWRRQAREVPGKMEDEPSVAAAEVEGDTRKEVTRSKERGSSNGGEEANAAKAAEAAEAAEAEQTKKNCSAEEDDAKEQITEGSRTSSTASVDAASAPFSFSQAVPQHSSENHGKQPERAFVIEEEEDTGSRGLVHYSAPEDQALDHLMKMASKGVRFLTSSAVAGIYRVRVLLSRTARRIGSQPVSDTLSKWFRANETVRPENMHAAQKALISMHHTTAVALARAPETIERYRLVIDQVAQRSVERGLELAVFSAHVAEVVGSASLQVARETKTLNPKP
jgi:hypothetical protein